MFDDGVEFGNMTRGARIGVDVTEQLVELGFAEALESAAIIDPGCLGGEYEIRFATNYLRIIASEVEVEEHGIVRGEPGVFDVGVEMGKVLVKHIARDRRLPEPLFIFLGERVVLLPKRCLGPREAQKARVERLPFVVGHELDNAWQGKRADATVGEKETAAKEIAGNVGEA